MSFFDSFCTLEPPIPCVCGRRKGEACSERGLKNHRNFSPFAYLQDVNEVDEDFYHQSETNFMYEASRHWALIADIESTFFVRYRVLVKTAFGESVPIHFHLEDATKPKYFNWKDMKKGYSMCTLYPKRHSFLDMTEGIRQERSDTVMVFPVSTSTLADEVSLLLDQDEQTCFGCQKKFANSLKKCARCKVTCYCSKDCQLKHWKQAHKKLCAHEKMLQNLANFDFGSFEGFIDWSFVPEMITPEEKKNRANEAIHTFFRSHGKEPLSESERVFHLFDTIKNKVMAVDVISKKVIESQTGGIFNEMMERASDNSFEMPLVECGLFQAFMDLCHTYRESNGAVRHHVFDLKSDSVFKDQANDILMSSLFLCLPQWQLGEGLLQINWAFETHHLLRREDIFNANSWDISFSGTEDIIAKNRNSIAFYNDDLMMVSEIAKSMAENEPDSIVIRVLRCTGMFWVPDYIDKVLDADTPENILTLWIREDLFSQGRLFNTHSGKYSSLREHLKDCREIPLHERVLQMTSMADRNK